MKQIWYGTYVMTDITSRMGITSPMRITRGMGTTGLFVVPGGRAVGWRLVIIRMFGRQNIITTDRIAKATGSFLRLNRLDEGTKASWLGCERVERLTVGK
jgi:hypothetical protein